MAKKHELNWRITKLEMAGDQLLQEVEGLLDAIDDNRVKLQPDTTTAFILETRIRSGAAVYRKWRYG